MGEQRRSRIVFCLFFLINLDVLLLKMGGKMNRTEQTRTGERERRSERLVVEPRGGREKRQHRPRFRAQHSALVSSSRDLCYRI